MAKYKQSTADITQGIIWKQMLVYFFPIFIGSLFQQLYNMVDTIVIGHAVGTQALAAVGATGSLIQLLIGFFVGIASGATVVVAQFYGARDEAGVSRTVHTAMAFSIVSALALTVVGIVTARPLLKLMDVPDDILDDATLYMQVYYAGMVGNLVYNIGTGILRAVGDSKRPLYILIVCSLVNVVLDLLFVLAFHWDVFGVAFATIISQLVSAICVVVILMRANDSYRFYFSKLRFDKLVMREMIRIGLPMGIESVVYSISNVFIQTAINGFGTACIAAWSAISRVDAIAWMIQQAFSVTMSTFVGQNFGAHNYDRVRKCARTGFNLNFVFIAVVSCLLFFFAGPLLRIFTEDEEVIQLGVMFIHIFTPAYLSYVFINVFSAVIRGAGESFQPMLISLIGICGLRFIWLFGILPLHHTMSMVAWSYGVSWVGTAIMFAIYYYRFNWLKRCKKHQQEVEEKQKEAALSGT